MFVLLTVLFCNAQDTIWVNGVPKITERGVSPLDNSQSPLQKDDYMFEIGYGVPFSPSQEASFFGLSYFNSATVKSTSFNSNHICARGDYMVSKDFSFGLELTYAAQQFQYTKQFTTYDTTGMPHVHDSLFHARLSKLRFLARLSYHLNISDRFDAYGTMGFGYKQFNYSGNDAEISSATMANQIMPIAIRASVGGRFFINDNFALNVEAGLGGPIMQIGITYKLHSTYYESKEADKRAAELKKKKKR